MGRGLEQTFFQRRHTDGQQAYEKILNTTNHEEYANKNHYEISPHTCQNGYQQKEKKKHKALTKMWRKSTLVHCWWECKLVQPLWKTV